ncbi:MAG: class I SAM-dependent methyltransferase, partial [Thermoplasmata archaeon]
LMEQMRFDVAFLDGQHDLDAARRDLFTLSRLVRPGGAIACHDATASHFGVGAAIDIMVENGAGQISQQVDTLKVIRLP